MSVEQQQSEPSTANAPTVSRPGAPLWNDANLRDPHGQSDKAARVQAMFDAIAPSYERFNSVATFGQDARWRRRAIRAANVQPGDVVLDVCCGTGDMLRTFARATPAPRRLIGLDFSREMLSAGRYDGLTPPVELVQGDALALPFDDASVDVVSCAFGVRNFQDLDRGLAEMRRVLRPRGRVVILEFAPPDNPVLRRLFLLYCRSVLPRLGAWLARDKVGAYRYLPESIDLFESARGMIGRLQSAGFENVTIRRMNLGGVVLYRAERCA